MMKVMTSGYDSYQPDLNTFDPSISRKINNADNGGTDNSPYSTVQAKPGQKMQINITINNATASVQTVELFQWLDSWTKRYKAEYATGNYLMLPMLSYEGLRRTVANTGGTVGFTQTGDLCVRGDDTVPNPVLLVGCAEVAYISLFNATSIIPFVISFIRETVTTNAQINNKLTWFRKTIAGGLLQNDVSPRAYFRPNQYQSLTIDIPVTMSIGVDSGVRLAVQANEVVQLALFIEFWTSQAL